MLRWLNVDRSEVPRAFRNAWWTAISPDGLRRYVARVEGFAVTGAVVWSLECWEGSLMFCRVYPLGSFPRCASRAERVERAREREA